MSSITAHRLLTTIACSLVITAIASAQAPQVPLSKLLRSDDPSIAKNAEILSRGLQHRRWTYVGDDDVQRTHEDSFKRILSNQASRVVEFTSGAKLPWGNLSADDRVWIKNILHFQTAVESDSRRYILLRQQAAAEAERLAIEQAEREQAELDRVDPKIAIAQLLVTTTANVSVGNQIRSIQVNRGERMQVQEVGEDWVRLLIGGQSGSVPRRSVRIREVRRSELASVLPHYALKPLIHSQTPSLADDDSVGPIVQPMNSDGWPRRLDVDIDYVVHRGVVQVLLNDVFANGVGDYMGLQPGDVITRIDDQIIRSEDQFRQAILKPSAPTFHVHSPAGDIRIVRYQAAMPLSYFLGVHAHLDEQNELSINYIARHDFLTEQLGLRRGDKILAACGQAVYSVEQLVELTQTSDGVLEFVLLREGHLDPELITVSR